MKMLLAKIAASGVAIASLGLMVPMAQAATPGFDASGNYVFAVNYLGTDYNHNVSLTQDGSGNITGSGTSAPYAWSITSGSVSGNTLSFTANYTATADAVTPLTTMHVTGTIASDGTISGNWSDNYQGNARTGTWHTTSGTASALGTLSAEDFGVVNYDTGLGFLKGYTAGFGLSGNTLAGATSVVVKLYGASDQLLQTNTAILSKFNADVTGTQFSSPFDVSGNFNYATDGYWTNVRESQYGQSIPAVKVVATVVLANGKTVTATNTALTGDPTTIYPVVATKYMLTYTAGAHGTLTGSTTQSVVAGADGAAVTAVPDSGYHFVKWSDNSIANPRTDLDVASNISVSASFAANVATKYTLTYAAAAHGSLTGSTTQMVNSGANGSAVTAVADSGYHFVKWSDGSTANPRTDTNVLANLSVTAKFAANVDTTPGDKNECKKGGWIDLLSRFGIHFKNQGQCVSSFVKHQHDQVNVEGKAHVKGQDNDQDDD